MYYNWNLITSFLAMAAIFFRVYRNEGLNGILLKIEDFYKKSQISYGMVPNIIFVYQISYLNQPKIQFHSISI